MEEEEEERKVAKRSVSKRGKQGYSARVYLSVLWVSLVCANLRK